MSSEAEIDSVDVAVPLAVSVTLLGLTEAVGQTKMRSDEDTVAFRLAVPESPFRLASVIVDVPEVPMTIVSELGEAPMLKSAGGGGGGFVSLHAANGWSSQWFSSQ